MLTDLDQLQWLTLLVWVSLLLLYLCLLAGLAVSARTLRLGLDLSWSERHTPSRRGLRPLLLSASVAIVCVFVLQISGGETLAVRLAAVLISGVVTWLFLDWASKQLHGWALRQSVEAGLWRGRAETATAQLLGVFDAEEILKKACALLHDELKCGSVFLFRVTDSVYSLAQSTPGKPQSRIEFMTDSLLHEALAYGLNFRAIRVFDTRTAMPVRWSRGPAEVLASEQELLASLRARLVVPLQEGHRVNGFFVLGPLPEDRKYEPHHIGFAEAVARQASQSVAAAERAAPEFGRVAEAAQEQASRRAARATRSYMAPPDRFELPDLDFASRYWVGDAPGGAAFDILSLPGRSAAFILIEIPGPAEEAAIRLVQLQALLRTRARAYHQDLAEWLDSTRRAIAVTAATQPPISLFCARYVSGARRLRYVNAGVFPPLLFRHTPDGAQLIRLLPSTDPLGPHSDAPIQEGEIELLPGDLLLIASSGLAQAAAPGSDSWGEIGLLKALLGKDAGTAGEVADKVLAMAAEHSAHAATQPPRILISLRQKA